MHWGPIPRFITPHHMVPDHIGRGQNLVDHVKDIIIKERCNRRMLALLQKLTDRKENIITTDKQEHHHVTKN